MYFVRDGQIEKYDPKKAAKGFEKFSVKPYVEHLNDMKPPQAGKAFGAKPVEKFKHVKEDFNFPVPEDDNTTLWIYIAIAVILLLMMGVITYFVLYQKKSGSRPSSRSGSRSSSKIGGYKGLHKGFSRGHKGFSKSY